MDYDQVRKFLEDNGYVFDEEQFEFTSKRSGYRSSVARSKGVTLGFCEPFMGCWYPCLDGKISADNSKCFDKWRKCPLCLPFPENEEQAKELLGHLEHLATEEGYKLSNEYWYLDNNPYVYSSPTSSQNS